MKLFILYMLILKKEILLREAPGRLFQIWILIGDLARHSFYWGGCAGLTAHVYEEQTQEKPMRKVFSIDCEYDGPKEQNL